MASFTFSSASLPDHLNDRQRFNLWRDLFTAQFGTHDFAISERLPFATTVEIASAGPIAFGRSFGTLERARRDAQTVAANGRDEYNLVINQGVTMSGMAARRPFELPTNAAVLMPLSETGMIARPATSVTDAWFNVIIPGPLLRSVLHNADDRVASVIPANNEALALLVGYTDLLQRHGAIASQELLQAVTNTLADLVVLSLGAKGQQQEMAGARGLRAARLHAVLGQIARRYTEVGFSTRDVADALGISARYVNDVVSESGINFSDRVLEHRLQRARAMLADRRNDGMRIGDIAYASGFADISHFNRSFRRRFGITPTGAR